MSRHVSACILFLIPALSNGADPTRLDRNGDPLPDGAVVRYGSARLRHPGGVKDMAFSRDGRTLASLGGQPATSVILWDVETGKAKARLNHDGLGGVAFGPNGALYLAAAEPTCLAWDPISGRTRPLAAVKVKDEPRAGRTIAISPDGATVAVGCDKGTIVWLDTATGKELGRLDRRDKPEIQSLVYSRDGQTMAVLAGVLDVFLVDVKRSRATRSYRLGARRGNVGAIALSPDGTRVAVSVWEEDAGNHVRMFDSASDQETTDIQETDVNSIAIQISTDGQTLRGFTNQGQLMRWSAAGGNSELMEKVSETVTKAVFETNGGRVAVAEAGGFIRIYETSAGKLLAPPTAASGVVAASFAGPGRATVYTRSGEGKLNLWAADTGSLLKAITATEAQVLNSDGTLIATWNSEASEVHILDPNTSRELWRFPIQNAAGIPAFSRDGHRLAVVRTAPIAVDVWDVARGRRLATLKGEDNSELRGSVPVWSPDGRFVMAFERSQRSDINGRIHTIEGITNEKCWIWEVATEKVRWSGTLAVDGSRPDQVAWGNAGSRLIVIQNRILSAYRVGQAQPLSETMIPADANTVSVSPDDRWVALGLKDGSIRVWEPSGARQLVAAGHTGTVTSLTFSADSKQLLSGSEDGTALLWDVSALPAFKPPPPVVPRLERDRHWVALGSAKGADVLAALDALAAHPAEAVALVRERVTPVAHTDAKRLARLVGELGEAKFEIREKAHRELSGLSERAEPALRAAAQDPANAEAKRRIEVLLTALEGPPTDPEVIRQIRAVELLERVGTPNARQLLAALAQGDAAARLTRESAAALGRWR